MSSGNRHRPVNLLVAEDDPEDRFLTEKALHRDKLINPLHFVEDGRALADYLADYARTADHASAQPLLILLDLYMPKASGLEFLWNRDARSDRADYPVLVLTGSEYAEDISDSYNLGAAGYVVKPVALAKLNEALTELPTHALRVVGKGGAPVAICIASSERETGPSIADEFAAVGLANDVSILDDASALVRQGGADDRIETLALIEAETLSAEAMSDLTRELANQQSMTLVSVSESADALPDDQPWPSVSRPLTFAGLCDVVGTLDHLSFQIVDTRGD